MSMTDQQVRELLSNPELRSKFGNALAASDINVSVESALNYPHSLTYKSMMTLLQIFYTKEIITEQNNALLYMQQLAIKEAKTSKPRKRRQSGARFDDNKESNNLLSLEPLYEKLKASVKLLQEQCEAAWEMHVALTKRAMKLESDAVNDIKSLSADQNQPASDEQIRINIVKYEKAQSPNDQIRALFEMSGLMGSGLLKTNNRTKQYLKEKAPVEEEIDKSQQNLTNLVEQYQASVNQLNQVGEQLNKEPIDIPEHMSIIISMTPKPTKNKTSEEDLQENLQKGLQEQEPVLQQWAEQGIEAQRNQNNENQGFRTPFNTTLTPSAVK